MNLKQKLHTDIQILKIIPVHASLITGRQVVFSYRKSYWNTKRDNSSEESFTVLEILETVVVKKMNVEFY